MILPIYVYGAEVLREKAVKVDIDRVSKEEMKTLLSNMYETMESADGVGLAAPQIGKNVRVLVVNGGDVSDTYPSLKDFKRAMINPVLLDESKETSEYSEGCLSIPDVHCNIVRAKKIRVSYLDENFKEQVEEFDDFACRMVQHEMDHLDGILFTDRAAPIRKKMIGSKLHNISKGKVKTFYKIKTDK